MLIIPAIDIIEEKVVRLERGDFNKEKVYSNEPVEVAKDWEKKGAKFLHIVDLDGAKEGKIKNADVIVDIIKNINIPCEIGGGIRSHEDIEYYLKQDKKIRVVLGTKATEDIDNFKSMVDEFKEKIAVSIDFKKISGKMYVAKTGWIKETNFLSTDLAKTMQDIGVQTIITTDISKDGMLAGPNVKGLKQVLNAVNISVIASGGISSLADIERLKEIKNKNLEGIIIGKALYEGRIDLQKAIELC